ncbi:hypothetical protein C5167_050213 [Papaver somniferum]|uniref:DNA topoisomerase n=1 Tax=Papaver somniferum TaxID=3469 RepID=A0A4Y7KQR0_PAPSO|nr:hypothetical protein C5167_050213 [Papaver somniferum]
MTINDKKKKTSMVSDGSLEGAPQVDAPSQLAKKSPSKTAKSAKDAKSESTKRTAVNARKVVKKVSVSKSKEKVPKIQMDKVSKLASRAKKVNGLDPAISSVTSGKSLLVGEEPLLVVSDSSVTDHRKKTSGKSTNKRKPKETKVPTKSNKVPTKQSCNPVLVEVNQNCAGTTIGPLYPPAGKSVVVVESFTKAKNIQRYLGDMYKVLPSFGHVRDLAGRSGSVRPDDDFSVVWEVPSDALPHLKNIKDALKGADNLILASDPDREGEAIAWHIIEMLQQQKAIHNKMTVARVVFHEITEESIKSAMKAPRDIDTHLIHAYLARRVLDYLIGFSISPLLWRKLPGCQSAGRVQSAALGIICDREKEIDEFKSQEYWTVEVQFKKMELGKAFCFPSHLTHLESKKLEQLSIISQAEAEKIKQKTSTTKFKVVNLKRSKTRRNPPAPYITSTLQQDAANKLHFTAQYTMKLAQKLYEGISISNDESTGLITYMRTDASLSGVLDEDSLKLYTLVWSRTMACQMEPMIIDQVQVDIGDAGNSLVFRSTSSKIEFSGYQAVYKDPEAAAIGNKDKEGSAHEEIFNILFALKKTAFCQQSTKQGWEVFLYLILFVDMGKCFKSGDFLDPGQVELKQHHTQPPSRYSEGSLVKKMEDLGIGRPSTYASTIKTLQDRKYLTVKSRILNPEFRGRMVSAFLSHHFSEVTDYGFTADMETELDNVSAGVTEWKRLLKNYWERFSSYCEQAGKVDIQQVEKMLEGTFEDFLFASLPDGSRTCPSCQTGTLSFKVSRYGEGYFIGCDQHPKCKYIAKTMYGEDEEGVTQGSNMLSEPKLLGLKPGSNDKILLKNGPYGVYVQLGEDRKGHSPKRASVSKIKGVDSITLDEALELLRYPITLGNHPEDGQPIELKLGKFGFTVKHRRTYASVPKSMDPKDVLLEDALNLLSSKDTRQSGRPKRKQGLKEAE